jgi:hypothetical protein
VIAVAGWSKAWDCGCSVFGLRVRIRPGAWMPVCCECDRLITNPGGFYRLMSLCVFKCNNNLESVGRQRTDRLRKKERKN